MLIIAAFLRDQYEPVRVQVDPNEIHYNSATGMESTTLAGIWLL